MSEPAPFEHPTQIGPYRILQIIGEGGMGVVYEAEQREPVRRRVALKMMKAGLDTKEVVARFEAERQALAVMDHPGIARVLDAGSTERGWPFFVMELVRGVRLDDYCDEKRLSTRERVGLVIRICGAVQHAHLKGVIHRDLKPSNVLVAESDGAAPKVIDFGIAKATGHQLSAHTIVTTHGQALGTLAYMSPEQAEMGGVDADSRADVYSLGVILYELLTGTVPVDPKEVGGPAFLVQLTERDSVLPTLWGRVSKLEKTQQDNVVRLRGTGLDGLRRELQGDLQWIVLKAVEKDRNRRYETANGLASDLRRYLEDEPILARPPTPTYRLRKFVRRNRIAVLAAASIGGAVLVGLIGTSLALVRARAAEAEAEQQTVTANSALDFMIGAFANSDPTLVGRSDVTAREVLDQSVAEIDALGDRPPVQARLLQAMGAAYTSLGLFEKADTLLLRAVELRRDGVEAGGEGLERSVRQLAWLYLTRGRYPDALPLAEESVAIALEEYGPVAAGTADALQVLGMVQRELADLEAARQSLTRSLEIREELLGPDHVDVGWSLFHLGWLAQQEEAFEEARGLYQRILPIFEAEFGPSHVSTADVLSDYAAALSDDTLLVDSAIAVKLRVLEIREAGFGPDHGLVGQTLNNLGVSYEAGGDLERAREHYARALTIYERAYGAGSAVYAQLLRNIAMVEARLGNLREAETAARDSFHAAESSFGADHPFRGEVLRVLEDILRRQGRDEEADQVAAQADEIGGGA